MKKILSLIGLAFLISLFSPSVSTAASSVVNHFDWNEPKISGINVNKTTGYLPGICIYNNQGYVIDLNPTSGATTPPARASVVNGCVFPK